MVKFRRNLRFALSLVSTAALIGGCAALHDEDANTKPTKKIEEAFGLNLGQRFSLTNQPGTTNYTSDQLIAVAPSATNPNFQSYFVALTPQTQLIWAIIAKSDIPGNFGTVRDQLTTKYGSPDDNMLVSMGSLRWRQKSRTIVFEKFPSGQMILRYEDQKLHNAANKESAQIDKEKRGRNDKSRKPGDDNL